MFLIEDKKHGSARSARSAYVISVYAVAWQPLISALLVATSQYASTRYMRIQVSRNLPINRRCDQDDAQDGGDLRKDPSFSRTKDSV